VDVLPQLTADDLKDIGVSAVGDRRRLLAGIATLASPAAIPAREARESPSRAVRGSDDATPGSSPGGAACRFAT
jgi:hypothetical protein